MPDVLKDLLGACKDKVMKNSKDENFEGEECSFSNKNEHDGAVKRKTRTRAVSINESDEEGKALESNFSHILGFLHQIETRYDNGMSEKNMGMLNKFNQDLNCWLQKNENKGAATVNAASGAKKKVRVQLGMDHTQKKTDRTKNKCTVDFKNNIKRTKKKQRKLSESSSNDEQDETDGYSGSDDGYDNSEQSESSDENAAGGIARKHATNVDELTDLMKVMVKLDNRKLSTFENYDEESGYSFEKYLKRFEEYCFDNVRGKQYMWIAELERHLKGRILEAFHVLKDEDDKYKDLKRKLLNWYRDMEDSRKKSNRKRFEAMKFIEGESLYLFCNKMEKQYKIAYPKHKVQHSSILMDKFKASLPGSALKMYKAHMMMCKFSGRKKSWHEIKKYAKIYDAEKEERDERHYENESVEEIIINVGESYPENTERKTNGNQNDGRFYEHRNHDGRPENFWTKNKNGDQKHTYGSWKNGNVHFGKFAEKKNNNRRNFRNGSPREFVNSNRGRLYSHASRYDTYRRQGGHRVAKFSNDVRENMVSCSICRRIGHTSEKCRIKNEKCFNCGKIGHYARQCYANSNGFHANRSQSLGPTYYRRQNARFGSQDAVNGNSANGNGNMNNMEDEYQGRHQNFVAGGSNGSVVYEQRLN